QSVASEGKNATGLGIQVQNHVERALLKVFANVDMEYNLSAFPEVNDNTFTSDKDISVIGMIFTFCIMTIFSSVIIVVEKHNNKSLLCRMVGVSDISMWFSWSLFYFLLYELSVIFLVITGTYITPISPFRGTHVLFSLILMSSLAVGLSQLSVFFAVISPSSTVGIIISVIVPVLFATILIPLAITGAWYGFDPSLHFETKVVAKYFSPFSPWFSLYHTIASITSEQYAQDANLESYTYDASELLDDAQDTEDSDAGDLGIAFGEIDTFEVVLSCFTGEDCLNYLSKSFVCARQSKDITDREQNGETVDSSEYRRFTIPPFYTVITDLLLQGCIYIVLSIYFLLILPTPGRPALLPWFFVQPSFYSSFILYRKFHKYFIDRWVSTTGIRRNEAEKFNELKASRRRGIKDEEKKDPDDKKWDGAKKKQKNTKDSSSIASPDSDSSYSPMA
ncbi:ABC transporter A like protein, partial [Aduncisulcus paluster]